LFPRRGELGITKRLVKAVSSNRQEKRKADPTASESMRRQVRHTLIRLGLKKHLPPHSLLHGITLLSTLLRSSDCNPGRSPDTMPRIPSHSLNDRKDRGHGNRKSD